MSRDGQHHYTCSHGATAVRLTIRDGRVFSVGGRMSACCRQHAWAWIESIALPPAPSRRDDDEAAHYRAV